MWKYVVIKETSDYDSSFTEIIKIVSSKERANEVVSLFATRTKYRNRK